jgi:hypothetical protein
MLLEKIGYKREEGARGGAVGWDTTLHYTTLHYTTLHYTTNRKVSGSITDIVIEILQLRIPSVHIMDLWSIQTVTEMSNRIVTWGVKASDAYSWRTYHLVEHSEPFQVCNGFSLILPLHRKKEIILN